MYLFLLFPLIINNTYATIDDIAAHRKIISATSAQIVVDSKIGLKKHRSFKHDQRFPIDITYIVLLDNLYT